MRGFLAGLLCGSALVGVLFAMAEEDAERVWALLGAAGLALSVGLVLRLLTVRPWSRRGAGATRLRSRAAASALPWPEPQVPSQH